ncbi:hypothetical protein ISF_04839 [Cordyceps fumosorosea ARSEF 2679]|uniref:Uncharacterized protein n=1 Tax=Cordyceps fumosorosea (strain ARSEF 2679) TaxID=1081104 RepID=A0A167VTE6_CORFA|nr:hypothetical protein ISF_04839 [Cordyceps fumosorosea ARSEF 2679]OAA62963.1 hypothetical protein ISF_04839 [Cordyceps fumosorosea ARSEF 2679]
MRPTPVGSLSAALLPTLCAAWGGLLEPNGLGLSPFDPGSKQWIDAVASSNASASYKVTGRDVTKPFPGSEMDGWTINVTAVDLTPFELGWDLKIMAPPSLYSKVDPDSIANKTVAQNVRNANGLVIANVDPSWFFCTFISISGSTFGNSSQSNNPENKETRPDGDCSPFLSQSCIDAIEKTASTSYATTDSLPVNPYGARGDCRGFGLPKECGHAYWDFGGDFWNRLEAPTEYMTGATTLVDGWKYARDKEHEDIDPVPSDGPLMWKSTTQDFIAVVTMFGKYKNGTYPDNAEPGFAKLSCVRPEPHVGKSDQGKGGNATDGKGKGESKGSDAGAISAVSGLLVAAVFILAL